MADDDSTRDPGLTALLERVAGSGAAAARPAPAARLRHTAEVRTTRRRLAGACLAVVAVLAGGAALINGPGTTNTAPTPANDSPAPTSLADPDGTYSVRSVSPGMLVDERTAALLGSTWASADQLTAGRDHLTPCQQSEVSMHRMKTASLTGLAGGPERDGTLTQVVASYEDEPSAETVYRQVVGWFTGCAGAVDESDAPGSLARRAGERVAMAGVDEGRVLVLHRNAEPGRGSTTVAAVTRVDNLVSMLAWDLTVGDPATLDDGFVDLSRDLAERLTGHIPAADNASAKTGLLTEDDIPVQAALGGTPAGSVVASEKVLRLDPLCGWMFDPPAAGSVHTQETQIAGGPGIVDEVLTRFDSVDSAQAAVAAAVARIGSCPTAQQNDGQRSRLGIYSGGLDDARAWSAAIRQEPAGTGLLSRQTAVLRRGALVATLRIDGYNEAIPDVAAVSVLEAAANRVRSMD